MWAKRVSLYLMRLLVLCIPVQLGLHFWPRWSLVLGRRIDYLSPTLYFTDCVAVAVLCCWLLSEVFIKEKRNAIWRKSNRVVIVSALFLFVVAGLNIYFSIVWQVAIFRWAKFLLFGFVVWFIATHKSEKPAYLKALVLGGVFSSLLAIVQFFLQHSVGGWMWVLGERSFALDTPLVARGQVCAVISGSCQLLLRPYATFAHPNILGGYLLVVLFLFVSFYKEVTNRFQRGLKTVIGYGVTSLLLVATLLTMSRSAIVVGIMIFLLRYLYLEYGHIYTIKTIIILFVAGTMLFGIFVTIPLRLNEESVVLRGALNNYAVDVIRRHWVFGVGLGNFVATPEGDKSAVVSFGIQPVHNIYLLALAELGVVGVSGLLFFGMHVWQKLRISIHLNSHPQSRTFLIVLLLVGILGLVDHYPWSLQQGQLLTSVLLGFFVSSALQKV